MARLVSAKPKLCINASPTSASPLRRAFSPSGGSRTVPIRPLLAAATRPLTSMTNTASWSGNRSRTELR